MSKAYAKHKDFFTDSEFDDGFDTDTGRPGIMLVANAIQFWSTQMEMQHG